MGNSILQYITPFVLTLIRYFLIAGIAFVIFYKLFPKKFSKNKIQARLAKKKDFIREILNSMQTMLVFSGIGLLILKTPLKSYMRVYENLTAHTLWWVPVSVVLALIIQDTYFYWMHSALHHPKIFKRIHLAHHKSINPSPWAAYSFHFLESILESLIAPVLFLLVPMHPIAIILFICIGFSINVYGHLGYEIAPRWFRHSILFEIINTSTHHNIHHSKFKGNYGLYFRFWDRIMKTEHPEYVKEYDRIQKRRFGTNTIASISSKSTFLIALAMSTAFLMVSAKIPKRIAEVCKDRHDGATIEIYKKDGLYVEQAGLAKEKLSEGPQFLLHMQTKLIPIFIIYIPILTW